MNRTGNKINFKTNNHSVCSQFQLFSWALVGRSIFLHTLKYLLAFPRALCRGKQKSYFAIQGVFSNTINYWPDTPLFFDQGAWLAQVLDLRLQQRCVDYSSSHDCTDSPFGIRTTFSVPPKTCFSNLLFITMYIDKSFII